MKLLKHIKKVAPIDNELDIQKLMSLFKSRNECIGIYQENLLLFYTVPELHDYLRNSIRSYRCSYKQSHNIKVYRSGRKREETNNGISKNGLSEKDKNNFNLFSYRNDNEQNTPVKKGYEYGLSDW